MESVIPRCPYSNSEVVIGTKVVDIIAAQFWTAHFWTAHFWTAHFW
jgi:hypothetical protein